MYVSTFILHIYSSGVAGRGAKGALPPPLPFSRENATRVLCTMTNYSQNKLLLTLRSVVNIDSNDFDKAGYKADILSTYLIA